MKLSKSERINDALLKMNIVSYGDVLMHLPRTYADFSPTAETNLEHKARIVVVGKIASAPLYSRNHKVALVTFSIMSLQGHFFKVSAFNRPYLIKTIKEGDLYTIAGSYDRTNLSILLSFALKGEQLPNETLRPIYSLPLTIENFEFLRLVKKSLGEIDPKSIKEEVPLGLRNKYKLLPKLEALRKIHSPFSMEDVHSGMRVLKYEECFLFAKKMQEIRAQNKLMARSAKNSIELKKINDFVTSLPYKLTKDQVEAVREIVLDMNQEALMYRLLQGDVGSGKTVVSAIALFANKLRGDQGALMAPTDSLAKQHFRTLTSLFKNTGAKVSLLVGSLTESEKRNIKEGLLDGLVDIVVGTHALFSADVVYQSLGLTIIDEQHRFGVNQRDLLSSKGEHADLLMMSATPIPRTLAMSLYSDMDVTTLTTFPFTQRKVTTKILDYASKDIDEQIKNALTNKKRVYIIAPLIEEGVNKAQSVEKLYLIYLKKFPGLVNILHGRLDQEEKELTLKEFEVGKKPIIVSTTVIEVGIDIKEASLMIIYEANHFGLASLHQLRGRIGRDGTAAFCLLLTDDKDEKTIERLNVLVESNDGFKIAEEDLKRRGPGELIGSRQSGIPGFNYVNIVTDFKMLELARQDAKIESINK
jgi:ATP-dependent DNA helicase RecG